LLSHQFKAIEIEGRVVACFAQCMIIVISMIGETILQWLTIINFEDAGQGAFVLLHLALKLHDKATAFRQIMKFVRSLHSN
jgi:hypothetical protein